MIIMELGSKDYRLKQLENRIHNYGNGRYSILIYFLSWCRRLILRTTKYKKISEV